MSLLSKIREHVGLTIIGTILAVLATLAGAGALSWTDARYVLEMRYTSDQVARGVLTIDMAIRQVDYRLRDSAQQEVAAATTADARSLAQARADQQFYLGEKQSLLLRRDDILKARRDPLSRE